MSLVTVGLLGVGCRMSLSPVKNRIGVGVESYIFFDADGEDGQGDLYAGSATGGRVIRATFSRAHESSPSLSPDGVMLAFIRGGRAADSAGHRVWVMNLLNGSEREISLPDATAHPQRVAWSADGRTLYIRTSAGDYQTPGTPSSPEPSRVEAGARLGAETALSVELGEPVIAVVRPCQDGNGLCAFSLSGGSQVLTPTGRNAFRWGTDSVGYFVGDVIEVRPLAGGSTREIRWTGVPTNPRTATHFQGGSPQGAP